MADEKKYPDDYVHFSEENNTGRRELIWCIPLTGSNGTYYGFTVSQDLIAVREKEVWDGSEMRDETKHYTFVDFSSGKTDEWIETHLGTVALDKIRAKLSEDFGIKSAGSKNKAADLKQEKAQSVTGSKDKEQPKRKFTWAALLLILFGLWLVWFPMSRLIVTIPQKFAWDISQTNGTVINSGLSEHVNYGKNTVTHVTDSWMSFRFTAEGCNLENRLEYVEYDSLVTDPSGKKWWLNTYPPGKAIPVYYYLNHPQYSNISKDSLVPGMGWMILDLFIALFGLICLVLGIGIFRK